MAVPPDHDLRMRRARLALDGLSIGDAFGGVLAAPHPDVAYWLEHRRPPPPTWETSAHTQMACAIVEVLAAHGSVDRATLAAALASRYQRDPTRDGYPDTAHWALAGMVGGLGWEEAAASVLDGDGSRGNDAAVRAAPIGGYFADDIDAVVREARASAEPTHADPDGQAGAIAVAVAAALACHRPRPEALIEGILARTPQGSTRTGLARVPALLARRATVGQADDELGAGARGLCEDTVPFALFCAARSLSDFGEVLWSTGPAGAAPTAIAGAVVALAVGELAAEWIAAREPL